MGKTGTTGKGTSYDEDRQHHPGKAPDRRTAPAGGLRCGGIFCRRVLSGGPRAAGGGSAGGMQAGKKRHGRAGGRGGGKHGLSPLRRGPAVLRDSGFDLCGAVRLPGYQVVPAGMVPTRHCGGRHAGGGTGVFSANGVEGRKPGADGGLYRAGGSPVPLLRAGVEGVPYPAPEGRRAGGGGTAPAAEAQRRGTAVPGGGVRPAPAQERGKPRRYF